MRGFYRTSDKHVSVTEDGTVAETRKPSRGAGRYCGVVYSDSQIRPGESFNFRVKESGQGADRVRDKL